MYNLKPMTSAITHFPNLETLTALAIFHYFLLFCRIGSAIMLMPGIGETFVPPTIRALLALFITLVVYLPLKDSLPAQPENLARLFGLVCTEIFVGLFLGGTARILLAVMHIVGMFASLQSGLANSVFYDPSQGTQNVSVGTFLTILSITLLFASDMHHFMLLGIIDSYHTFKAGNLPPVGDFSDFSARIFGDSFRAAFMISAPMMVVGFFMYVAGGLMSRLMPSIQIFFLIVPVQIAVTFLILALTLSAAMMWYLNFFKEGLSRLFSVG